jgi:hypothetical protein
MAADDVVADSPAPPAEDDNDLGLPGWLDDMLKPGVGQGVFTTLKLSLVGLVGTLVFLLFWITDEARRQRRSGACFSARLSSLTDGALHRSQTARFHISVFLAMSIILLVLVVWFINEVGATQRRCSLRPALTRRGCCVLGSCARSN